MSLVPHASSQPTSPPPLIRARTNVIVAKDGAACMLVDLLSEQYYTLNHSATYVWQLLCDGVPLTGVAEALASTYNIDRSLAVADVTTLITQLAGYGLVTTNG